MMSLWLIICNRGSTGEWEVEVGTRGSLRALCSSLLWYKVVYSVNNGKIFELYVHGT